MSLCLTPEEIRELTGRTRKALQISFLQKNGIRHYLDSHGKPVVTRAAVEGVRDLAQPKQAWKSNKAA